MKREIKFRAWTGNRMIDFKEVCDMHATPWNSTSLIWMQFTGLKDKNGKEIYEGDIVKERQWNQEIVWSDANSGFWVGGVYHLSRGMAQEIEIIGNIYENPELLSN